MMVNKTLMDGRKAALETFRATHGIDSDGVGIYRLARAGRLDLVDLFGRLGYLHGVELGTWQGRFAEVLCRRIPALRLVCVDPWRQYSGYHDAKNNQARLEQAYAEAHRRLDRFPMCSIWRMSSFEAASHIKAGALDFVYIDGNHAKQYVLQDLRTWAPKVRKGGIIAGHDYNTRKDKPTIEVEEAVHEFVADRNLQLCVLAADKSPSFFWVVP